ncbi:hypothetical protein DXG03_003222 [Asterophora parasitica]|uniref:Uncharacterized protein n=1 Tax=Asterophora parasitica TaxID=117018 RepID=A0A9P7KE03_9AGAR|nr:hypothetical protein DXG03_003222 [Asterophora parasitica]
MAWDSQWERDYIRGDILNYVYPPPDLLTALVDAYFVHVNVHLPLLHRPTFEKSLAENLHYASPSFGAFLVCFDRFSSSFLGRTLSIQDEE